MVAEKSLRETGEDVMRVEGVTAVTCSVLNIITSYSNYYNYLQIVQTFLLANHKYLM